MSDRKKTLETLLFSTVGVIGVLIILIAVNSLFGRLARGKARIDVTQDRVNTLSDGTKAILRELDTDVVIRFYYTQSENALPVYFRNYAERIRDLLDSYEQQGGKHIRVEILDPQPDSDAEDSANLDGIPPQPVSLDTQIYFGMSFTCVDQKATIPFLLPEREPLLEYDISSKISEVTAVNKPIIGILSSLDMFGSPALPPQFGGGGAGKPEWLFVESLKAEYEVQKIEATATEIPANVSLLIVAHPPELQDPTKFAIDQFVLRGGKLAVFVDPLSAFNAFTQQSPNPMMPSGGNQSSNLSKLLQAWGVEYTDTQVVADRLFSSTMGGRNGAPQVMPAVLSLTSEGVNKDDVVTGQIDNLVVPFAGQLKVKAPEGVKSEVLLHSSEQSQLVESFAAQNEGERILSNFAATGEQMTLAVRLTGKFKTAYPDGKPAAAPPAEGEQPKPEEPKNDAASLKESTQATSIVVVSDSDLLYDEFSVRVQNIFGQRVMIPMNANLDFCRNIVDQLAGDANLIGIRSRGTVQRPFTRIQKMEAAAQDQYQEKLSSLETKLQEASTKLQQLQVNKDPGQKFILSPEQQAEIEKFQQEEANTKKELKELRRQLRRDTDKLKTFLTWMNILAMPLVVIAGGVGVAIGHRRMQKAS